MIQDPWVSLLREPSVTSGVAQQKELAEWKPDEIVRETGMETAEIEHVAVEGEIDIS